MTTLREGLPPLPKRMLHLPLDPRGYPIPWFVGELRDGTRDFRIADQRKRALGHKNRLCWLCGGKLGSFMAFVIGPMCVVNRNTSEPGSHLECARFAAIACPHLSRPEAKNRTAGLPEDRRALEGSLAGNPGACAVYVCTQSKAYRVPEGRDWLISLGEPTSIEWYCRGRQATREEIDAVLEARLPLLREIAMEQGPKALDHLALMVARAKKYLPAESAA